MGNQYSVGSIPRKTDIVYMGTTLSSLSGSDTNRSNDSIKCHTKDKILSIHNFPCVVAEFMNKVCLIKEHAATQLLQAVETFRKKGNEIKKER